MQTRIAIALALVSACTYAHVGSGQVAVVRTPGGLDKTVYTTGDWKIGWNDHATTYDARSQEHAERLEVQAADGLGITLDTSIRFHIVPDEVVALHDQLGERYYDILLGPTLRSQARRVVGRFKPEEIYSTQRDEIERQITDGVTAAIKGRHVVVEAVLVRGVTLPEQIQQAITNKLEAEQAALKMKFVLASQEAQDEQQLMATKAEAERRKIEAEATAQAAHVQLESSAEAVRMNAQAAADAKRTDAQATADYQALVQKTLTKEMLRLKEIEARRALADSPNAKLVLMGGEAGKTVLDLREENH
jgi:regulator of protease activity HflC (stomatin/prohibitin superfamily)